MRGDVLVLGAVGLLAVAGLARRGAGNEEAYEDPDSLLDALWAAVGSPPREGPSADWTEQVWSLGPLQAAPDRRYRLFLFKEDSGELSLIWRLQGEEVSLLGSPVARIRTVDDDTMRFREVKHFSIYSVADVARAAAWLNENVPALLGGEIPRGDFE